LKAQVEFALAHDEVGAEFGAYLDELHARGSSKVIPMVKQGKK